MIVRPEEDEVDDNVNGKADSSKHKVHLHAVQETKSGLESTCNELERRNGHDHTCDCVLSTLLLARVAALLAQAEENDQEGDQSRTQEWEVDLGQVVDGLDDTSSLVLIDLVAFWACSGA